MQTIIYHNPRCTKSRQSLELLRNQGIEPTVIEYLRTPPSADELRSILSLLGLNARDIIRTKEPEYQQLDLANPLLSEDQLVQLLVDNPKLIERPIIINDGKATIGRPPEKIFEVL